MFWTARSLEAVARFSFSMSNCLSAGLPVPKALELSAATARGSPIHAAALAAAETCREGLAISDGLQPMSQRLPAFLIPVIRAGEESGRLVEAYGLIRQHAERLVPVVRSFNNAWIAPLICVVAGWAIRTLLLVSFGLGRTAWELFRSTFVLAAALCLVLWTLLRIPALRYAVDSVILQLPPLRETILRIQLVVFFATYRLAYEAGGLGALTTFDLALAAVGNRAVRADLSRARPILQNGGSIEEAIAEPRLIDDAIRCTIATGAASGNLGRSLDDIVRTQTVDLEITLDKFNRIFQRLLVYTVGCSIAGTLLLCLGR